MDSHDQVRRAKASVYLRIHHDRLCKRLVLVTVFWEPVIEAHEVLQVEGLDFGLGRHQLLIMEDVVGEAEPNYDAGEYAAENVV